jgi:pyrimidine-nucleoside phosphorylase/thymidine phosphorylase
MRAVDLIRKKRDGGVLGEGEIRYLVEGLALYQWSALLMAIVWRGLDEAETAVLVDAMLRSGVVVDLSGIPGPKVDKHSTGGVGDKTSLILAPIAAACGVTVPMVSGRGLGHTGGTLDKLEAIPGFRVDLDLARYEEVARECGLVLIGQTDEIAPADRTLYALRDATGTVESIPLITASILSKKLAEGIDGLVLDVKTGDGAFMREREDAKRLAASMTRIGRAMGKKVSALLTRMDQPLGRMVGNAVEVVEAVECLRGHGPADLVDLSVELAAEMLVLGEAAGDLEEARRRCRGAIADGSALERLVRVIRAQGGDARVIEEPGRLPGAACAELLEAEETGYVTRLLAGRVGHATMLVGAGRLHMDSAIDHGAGVVLLRKVGEPVERGDVLAELRFNPGHAGRAEEALEVLRSAYEIGPAPGDGEPLILERMS